MSFDLGNIVGSINKAVLPTAFDATVPDTGSIEHEPVHAQLAGTPESNPAAANAQRQGIIVIGGHENPSPPPIKASTDDALVRQGIIIIGGDVPLHPAVAPAVAALGDAGGAGVKGLGDALQTVLDGPVLDPGPKPGTEGGGFSGFLHTIANLGRG